jgi:hypothetical protein
MATALQDFLKPHHRYRVLQSDGEDLRHGEMLVFMGCRDLGFNRDTSCGNSLEIDFIEKTLHACADALGSNGPCSAYVHQPEKFFEWVEAVADTAADIVANELALAQRQARDRAQWDENFRVWQQAQQQRDGERLQRRLDRHRQKLK